MKRILAVIPFVVDDDLRQRHEAALNKAASPGTVVRAVSLTTGPAPMDYEKPGFRHADAEVAELVERLQPEFDAAFINCFEDPGLTEARRIARIPVAGPLETAVFLARSMGERFMLVSPDPNGEGGYRRAIEAHGAGALYSAFLPVDFEVGGDNDHESAVETLSSVIRRGRAEHQANLAVLACTDFLTLHADIVKRVGGCVIEPATTAVRALELQLGTQAKRAGAAA